MEILKYLFVQNALLGSLLACIACGIIGTYIVTRRMVFISGGITHSSFGGVGLGIYLSVNPVITAFLFALLSAFGVQWLGRHKEVRDDSAIAIFWTLGMALGVFFTFLTPGYTSELSTYLFGNILTITGEDILLLGVISTAQSIFTILYFSTIRLIAFDSEYARSRKIHVNIFENIMMFFIALTIVATLRMLGIVMVIAMLTIPQMTAMLFTYNYKSIIISSILLGYLATILGLYLSFMVNVPSGATIIICSIVFWIVAKTISYAINAKRRMS